MIEKNWSKEEIEKLKKLYPYFRADELARFFKRTEASIFHKARRLGLKKDKDATFIHKSESRLGAKSSSWKGGRKINKKGHVLVLDKYNPQAERNGYILEHRKVMSEHIGRPLNDGEVVHHINGDKTDNRIENLQLMERGEHTRLHHIGSKRSEIVKENIRKGIAKRSRRRA